jgi:LPXTG-motif cell wall-anchored protein
MGGGIVRKPVRKFLGAALFGLLVVFVTAPGLAGAQTVPGEGAPPVPGDCTFSVTPNPITAIPSTVSVAGTAPGGVTVELFVDGAATPAQSQVLPATPNPGQFSFALSVTHDPTSVEVSYLYGNKNAYVQGCTDIAGNIVTRITKATAPTEAPAVASKLAFTGSNDTTTYVLIGAAAVVVGLVLVVAARRRSRVNG